MTWFRQFGFVTLAEYAAWLDSMDQSVRLMQAQSRRNKRRKRKSKQARLARREGASS